MVMINGPRSLRWVPTMRTWRCLYWGRGFSDIYTPQNKHGTWKWTLGKGDSYWKPSFPGSMLIFGGVGGGLAIGKSRHVSNCNWHLGNICCWAIFSQILAIWHLGNQNVAWQLWTPFQRLEWWFSTIQNKGDLCGWIKKTGGRNGWFVWVYIFFWGGWGSTHCSTAWDVYEIL